MTSPSSFRVLGVDPGESTGLAVVGEDKLLGYHEKIQFSKFSRDPYGSFQQTIDAMASCNIAVIECQYVGASAHSSNEVARKAGWYEGFLAGIGIKMILRPKPTEWQCAHDICGRNTDGTTKDLSVAASLRLFGEKLSHDVADASLMALFGVNHTLARLRATRSILACGKGLALSAMTHGVTLRREKDYWSARCIDGEMIAEAPKQAVLKAACTKAGIEVVR